MTNIPCANCGIVFGIPDAYASERREDRRTFYCPNGHSLSYKGETKAETLARRLKWAEQSAASNRERAEQAERSRTALKGVVTRMKRQREEQDG